MCKASWGPGGAVAWPAFHTLLAEAGSGAGEWTLLHWGKEPAKSRGKETGDRSGEEAEAWVQPTT